MKTAKELKFQIKGVEMIKFDYSSPASTIPEGSIFNFDIEVKHKINKEKRSLYVLVTIVIRLDSTEDTLGKVEVGNVFIIENFNEVVEEVKANNYQIEDNYSDILNGIAISTTRGVMAATFRGTPLHHAILPVVQPRTLRKNRKQE